MTDHDDIEAFVQMFENTTVREGWESEDWSRLLAPLLTGEAQRAYFALLSAVSDTYSELKKEILARLGLLLLAHSGPGSRARRHRRPSPPCSSKDSPQSGRDAEPCHRC